jgi:hypothetical protein
MFNLSQTTGLEIAGWGGVGLFFAALIWPKHSAKTPSNTARKFAAFVAFISIFSNGGRLYHDLGFGEQFIITFVLIVVLYTSIGGAVGWIYGHFVQGYPIATNTRPPKHKPNRAPPPSPASRSNISADNPAEPKSS